MLKAEMRNGMLDAGYSILKTEIKTPGFQLSAFLELTPCDNLPG
jgi:hypothetical protein